MTDQHIAPPDDREALAMEIERTREELTKTVEALAAKADVKARAKDMATGLSQRLPDRGQLKRAATTAGDRRVPVAVAAAAGLAAGWLLLRRRRR